MIQILQKQQYFKQKPPIFSPIFLAKIFFKIITSVPGGNSSSERELVFCAFAISRFFCFNSAEERCYHTFVHLGLTAYGSIPIVLLIQHINGIVKIVFH
jgi:hypothetical protein